VNYEELRTIVVELLLGEHRVSYAPEQWANLKLGVAEVSARQKGQTQGDIPRLSPVDSELLRDVFWDLFRQGYITLGMNDSNPAWPFFRLSHLGKTTLTQNVPYRFTDSSSYLDMVRSTAGKLDELTVMYLDEAVQAFYAGCLLASCVMLGVAAEQRFNSLLATLETNRTHGPAFKAVGKERAFLAKVTKFKNLLQPSLLAALPSSVREDLDVSFLGIQSLIRTHRNEAGHPSGTTVGREKVYMLLQMFAPYAKKLAELQKFFASATASS
jgi:hypothetical protein